MDMSGPYKSAVSEFLPHLDIVFDRFHVMKLMNEVIDEITSRTAANLQR